VRKVKFKVVAINGIICGRRFSAFAEGNYALDYPRGAIVRAREGTLGIAVFETWKQADDFRVSYEYQEIVRVRPIGRGKVVKYIASVSCEADLDVFYEYREKQAAFRRYSVKREVPPGTIFYPAVEVLE